MEADLVRDFAQLIGKKSGKRSYVTTEFEGGGYGIADVTIFKTKTIEQSAIDRFSSIPPRFAVLFNGEHLPSQFRTTDFCNLTGISISAAHRILTTLVVKGTIARNKSNEYVLERKIECPIELIISVEAKLSDWRSALVQAYRNRAYSNQSWVLLDAARARRAIENWETFSRAGIGLATLDKRRQLKIYFQPQYWLPLNRSLFWAASVRLTRKYLRA